MSDATIRLESAFTERDILGAIERATGQVAMSAEPMPGGMISDVRKVTFIGGEVAVCKYMEGPDAHFDVEAGMIECMRDSGVVPVPTVLYSSRELLLLEYMPGRHMTPAAEPHLGALLANLHDCQGEAFGFAGSTLNGSFLLPNGWWETWIPFFRETRLRHSANASFARGMLSPEFLPRIDRLCERLEDLLIEPAYPALVHGDLWSSNVLAIGKDVTALIDPSTHYGHPEIDVANAVLFGNFGDAFTRAYTLLRPLDDDFWSTRMYVYGTYSALMHVYFFGDRYEPMLDRIMAKLGL